MNELTFENTCKELDAKMDDGVLSTNSHLNLEELIEYYHYRSSES